MYFSEIGFMYFSEIFLKWHLSILDLYLYYRKSLNIFELLVLLESVFSLLCDRGASPLATEFPKKTQGKKKLKQQMLTHIQVYKKRMHETRIKCFCLQVDTLFNYFDVLHV